MNIAFRRTSGTSRHSALYTAGTQVPFFSAAIYNPKVLLSTVRSKYNNKINVGVE
jgi:hypothetical protein